MDNPTSVVKFGSFTKTENMDEITQVFNTYSNTSNFLLRSSKKVSGSRFKGLRMECSISVVRYGNFTKTESMDEILLNNMIFEANLSNSVIKGHARFEAALAKVQMDIPKTLVK
jgi:hypothetical protein